MQEEGVADQIEEKQQEGSLLAVERVNRWTVGYFDLGRTDFDRAFLFRSTKNLLTHQIT